LKYIGVLTGMWICLWCFFNLPPRWIHRGFTDR